MKPEDRARARALLDAQQFDDARRFLAEHRPEPDEIEWLAIAADVEGAAEQPDAAVALYERLLDIDPEHTAALYNASVVLSDMGRHDDAMEKLEALVEVEGESAEVLNDLSFEYAAAEHNVPALLAAERAEQLAESEELRCVARINAVTALANMEHDEDALERIDAMLAECTGACGEREAAEALRTELRSRLTEPGQGSDEAAEPSGG